MTRAEKIKFILEVSVIVTLSLILIAMGYVVAGLFGVAFLAVILIGTISQK